MAASAENVIDEWLRCEHPAVIFDFNGTLSNDEPILFDIFGEVFREHLDWTMTPEYYREHLLGRSDREIVEHAVALRSGGGDLVTELLKLRQSRYQHRVIDDNPIDEATVELVRLLAHHRIPLGIVTGAQRDDVLAVLAGSPVGDLFGVLIADEDVTVGKPDPQGYLAGATSLGRTPHEVLVFEDSVPGVQAALAAGMHCIAVDAADSNPDLRSAAPAVVSELSSALVADALSRHRTH